MCFNPRTCEGCDVANWGYKPRLVFQSTHLRGVRLPFTVCGSGSSLFQSTHLRGVRPMVTCSQRGVYKFQSTHLRGVRLRNYIDNVIQIGFNPRTCEGCDHLSSCRNTNVYRFNPRTCEGCDPVKAVLRLPLRCFNPRTCEGCDFKRYCSSNTQLLFQSTHLRGVRRFCSDRQSALWAFQSTHLRGVRPGHLIIVILFCQVSIHAPARGATRTM